MSHNSLVHGKNIQTGIVSLEVRDTDIELFIQESDGSIRSEVRPNKSWLLAEKRLHKSFAKLKGNLHYQYGKQFDSKSEMNKWAYIYDKKNGEDVYRIYNPKEASMVLNGYTYYKGLNPTDISVLSFDIETTGLNELADDAFVIVISATYRDIKGTSKFLWDYTGYESQAEMLLDFCVTVTELDPSIILGHNCIQYDLKYLQAAANRAGIELNLGRDGSEIKWGNPSYKKKFRVDGNRELEYQTVDIYGREIVDTYFMAQAFDVLRTMDSYGLKPMIKQLGLEDPNRTYYDASQIRNNYKDPVEFEKIINYCKDDSDDPIKLWDKMGPLFFHMAPMIPKSFQEIVMGASGSKLNGLMVRAYLQDGHSIPKATKTEPFPGGLSWGNPGIYRNVVKVDARSLYPSVILAYKIFDSDKDPNGYLLELVKTFRDKRLEYKKLAKETGAQHWSDMDNAAKGILNSFFGFCSAPGLNFNSPEVASFITEKGREILSHAILWATGKDFKELAPEYFEEEEIS